MISLSLPRIGLSQIKPSLLVGTPSGYGSNVQGGMVTTNEVCGIFHSSRIRQRAVHF